MHCGQSGLSRCGAVLGAALAVATATAQTLSFVERSSGLSQPGLEAGNTELEFWDVNGDGHPDLVSFGDHGNPGIGGGDRKSVV